MTDTELIATARHECIDLTSASSAWILKKLRPMIHDLCDRLEVSIAYVAVLELDKTMARALLKHYRETADAFLKEEPL